MLSRLAIFAVLSVLFPWPGAPSQERAPIALSFGVYTSDKATVMYKKFTPVLKELRGLLEKRLGSRVDIRLRIYNAYQKALDALVSGDVDLVRCGPASYILAKQRQPKVALLVMESKKGKRTFKGMIVVRRDSPIQTLEDLRGKRFAFGDRNSTIGRYLAQVQLLNAHIKASDLKSFRYLGRHDKVFRAVAIGDFDAGSLKSGTFNKLNTKGTLRVLVSFDNVTKPWVARAGLDPEVTKAMRQSLLRLNRPEALKNLRISGFLPATDDAYAGIRQNMRLARQFDPKPAGPGR